VVSVFVTDNNTGKDQLVAKTITVPDSTDLLPDPQVAKRYSVNPRTLYRWDERPTLDFPRPLRINRRKYRRVEELEAWERQRRAAS
jgi:predicted DNA-binding transcriptional regulator AlpA